MNLNWARTQVLWRFCGVVWIAGHVAVAAATLTNRYSFTDVNDSVGDAHGVLVGAAMVAGGKLVLDGSPDTFLDRIWEGRLTSEQLAANYRSGPDELAGPVLAAGLEGGNLVLAWPVSASGYILESSAVLGAGANWAAAGATAVSEGGFYQVTLPLTATSFYRLRK